MYRFFTHDGRLVELPMNTRRTLGVYFLMQISYVITFLLILRQRHRCIRDSSSLETRRVRSFLQKKQQFYHQIKPQKKPKFNHLEYFYAHFISLYLVMSIKTSRCR